MDNREEVLIRIIVAIVSGIIFYFWTFFIVAICIINWIYTLFTNKKIKEIKKACNLYHKL